MYKKVDFPSLPLSFLAASFVLLPALAPRLSSSCSPPSFSHHHHHHHGPSAHKKWHHERDPERPAPTRHRWIVFCERNISLQKSDFPSYISNWTRAANIGASLRRPNPREGRPILFFYNFFFKMGAA